MYQTCCLHTYENYSFNTRYQRFFLYLRVKTRFYTVYSRDKIGETVFTQFDKYPIRSDGRRFFLELIWYFKIYKTEQVFIFQCVRRPFIILIIYVFFIIASTSLEFAKLKSRNNSSLIYPFNDSSTGLSRMIAAKLLII